MIRFEIAYLILVFLALVLGVALFMWGNPVAKYHTKKKTLLVRGFTFIGVCGFAMTIWCFVFLLCVMISVEPNKSDTLETYEYDLVEVTNEGVFYKDNDGFGITQEISFKNCELDKGDDFKLVKERVEETRQIYDIILKSYSIKYKLSVPNNVYSDLYYKVNPYYKEV